MNNFKRRQAQNLKQPLVASTVGLIMGLFIAGPIFAEEVKNPVEAVCEPQCQEDAMTPQTPQEIRMLTGDIVYRTGKNYFQKKYQQDNSEKSNGETKYKTETDEENKYYGGVESLKVELQKTLQKYGDDLPPKSKDEITSAIEALVAINKMLSQPAVTGYYFYTDRNEEALTNFIEFLTDSAVGAAFLAISKTPTVSFSKELGTSDALNYILELSHEFSNHNSPDQIHQSIKELINSETVDIDDPQSCFRERLLGMPCLRLLPPLIVDLDSSGLSFSRVDGEHQVKIDVGNDGIFETVTWPIGNSALVIYDYDGSGDVTDYREAKLSTLDGKNSSSDYDGLVTLDSNNDGQIDESDPEYHNLYLWMDSNSDAKAVPHEVMAVSEVHGIFHLDYKRKMSQKNNVVILGSSTFSFGNGKKVVKSTVYDTLLSVKVE